MAAPPAGLAVIDVSRYLRAVGSATEGEELEKAAAALRGACETIGFYYLTGFDGVLPRDVCRRALAAARCVARPVRSRRGPARRWASH